MLTTNSTKMSQVKWPNTIQAFDNYKAIHLAKFITTHIKK
ncbi:hypothetical protein F383_22709 [Gossypium arboreum]|uniref:Uncharacterized protein n=1 Tax=Gossypium arboreum TaxID=29729 RepID=A0A0B0NWY4_GOSAR|nr:hypothetical protein F383_22709 [Gossypium arboreum]